MSRTSQPAASISSRSASASGEVALGSRPLALLGLLHQLRRRLLLVGQPAQARARPAARARVPPASGGASNSSASARGRVEVVVERLAKRRLQLASLRPSADSRSRFRSVSPPPAPASRPRRCSRSGWRSGRAAGTCRNVSGPHSVERVVQRLDVAAATSTSSRRTAAASRCAPSTCANGPADARRTGRPRSRDGGRSGRARRRARRTGGPGSARPSPSTRCASPAAPRPTATPSCVSSSGLAAFHIAKSSGSRLCSPGSTRAPSISSSGSWPESAPYGRIAAHREVHVAARLVGVAGGDQLLDQGDDLGAPSRSPAARRRAGRCPAGWCRRCTRRAISRGELGRADAPLPGGGVDLLVDVGDVLDQVNGSTAPLQVALHQLEDDVRPGVAHVDAAVDGGPADVDADPAVAAGLHVRAALRSASRAASCRPPDRLVARERRQHRPQLGPALAAGQRDPRLACSGTPARRSSSTRSRACCSLSRSG